MFVLLLLLVGNVVCLSCAAEAMFSACMVCPLMRDNNQLMRGIHLVISARMIQRMEKRLFGTCGMCMSMCMYVSMSICMCVCVCVNLSYGGVGLGFRVYG